MADEHNEWHWWKEEIENMQRELSELAAKWDAADREKHPHVFEHARDRYAKQFDEYA